MAQAQYKGTTSIGLVREALSGAIQRGLDVQPILQFARIDPELLNAPQARVEASAFSRLWIALSDQLDDEFFGIDSHPMRRGSFQLMCHAVIGCRSLEHALQRILAFLRSILDDIYGTLEIEGDEARIIIHDHGIERRLFAYGTWLILVHGLLCWLANRRIPLQEVRFRPARPEDDSDYRMRFCADIEYGSATTWIRFDRSFLSLKIAQNNSHLSAFLREAPGNLLVKYRNDESLSALIRHRLREQGPDDWPELDAIAKDLRISSSTFQRRLQAEGTSYQRLKDDLRRDMAINLLSRAELSVSDVAALTGFQETSAFHRAFKKWTGVSPGAYRSNPAAP
ncbi:MULTISPECIES: AraC family transcriptional regulator [unclassified Pseudomonas]|uniref:AraC family transcriptional regulator n=1 Tax=unclassified Pseudomonas TaxID=196821 RepID=UPI0005392B59|nr:MULTISPECIES: AraC family transcriptional regulator [unclassified Pseudomonas]MBD0686108.1 AraC family transcriptional regulator [Pseudomonas sp. PSB18]CDF96827.1 Transcriptional regulator, AraC family [Pseudomonas sp. SHC52]